MLREQFFADLDSEFLFRTAAQNGERGFLVFAGAADEGWRTLPDGRRIKLW